MGALCLILIFCRRFISVASGVWSRAANSSSHRSSQHALSLDGLLLGEKHDRSALTFTAVTSTHARPPHAHPNKQSCVLVTIYRRESDLFALLLREAAHGTASGSGSGRARGASARATVLCDMVLDDGVHLEPQGGGAGVGSSPLIVKVVNTCEWCRCW